MLLRTSLLFFGVAWALWLEATGGLTLRLAQMGRSVETDGDNNIGGNVAENRGEPRPPRMETLADHVKRYGSALIDWLR